MLYIVGGWQDRNEQSEWCRVVSLNGIMENWRKISSNLDLIFSANGFLPYTVIPPYLQVHYSWSSSQQYIITNFLWKFSHGASLLASQHLIHMHYITVCVSLCFTVVVATTHEVWHTHTHAQAQAHVCAFPLYHVSQKEDEWCQQCKWKFKSCEMRK